MSKEAMEKFRTQLATDSALAEKAAEIEAQYVKSLTELAKEAGCEVSGEDLISEKEQLSEDDLVGAAGGGYVIPQHPNVRQAR